MSARPSTRAIAGCLLGTHVVRCAEREPGLGQPLGARGGKRSCDAEVRHDRLSAGQQDVLGLDVAVHYAVLVGIAQCGRHVPGDVQGLGLSEVAVHVSSWSRSDSPWT